MSIILKVTEKCIKHKVGDSEIELPVSLNILCVDVQRSAPHHSIIDDPAFLSEITKRPLLNNIGILKLTEKGDLNE